MLIADDTKSQRQSWASNQPKELGEGVKRQNLFLQ